MKFCLYYTGKRGVGARVDLGWGSTFIGAKINERNVIMRATQRRRPLKRVIDRSALSEEKRAALAQHVTYIGSAEHKDTPSFAGPPRPRADASICDQSLAKAQAEITEWLRQAIQQGQTSAYLEGGYPRYAWYKVNDTLYEARLVNQEQGAYKGYPLNPSEWPEGL